MFFGRIQSFSIRINVLFSRKTYQICHCEEGAFFAPDAAIFNETICHPVAKYG